MPFFEQVVKAPDERVIRTDGNSLTSPERETKTTTGLRPSVQ